MILLFVTLKCKDQKIQPYKNITEAFEVGFCLLTVGANYFLESYFHCLMKLSK